MHVQHVHGKLIGCQVHGLEDLLQRHRSLVLGQANHRVRVRLDGLLDEPQEMLLVHARGRVNMGVHLDAKSIFRQQLSPRHVAAQEFAFTYCGLFLQHYC